MNPLTNIRNQNKINDRELLLGFTGSNSKSWHQKYSDSAWIYIGGLPYDLNEGDVIAVFSQYGEIVNINLIRDRKTGKSRGFAFVCYEDQRSTILAVDNFNGIKLLKRIIRVDHVEEYKVPKYHEDIDEETRKILEDGCAPKPIAAHQADESEDVDPVETLKKKGAVDKDGVVKVDKALEKKLKKEQKRLMKEAKKARKEEKLRKRKLKEEQLELEKKVEDDESWKKQKKLIDLGPVKEEEIYGGNEHFNFGKPKKEIPPLPSHNPRPDFEKADWRDIEMWKAVREKEKQEKGEKETNWKEEEHYLPSRFRKE
ncbi:MNN4 protein, putative [Brugia malayi]|uniref:MNN4 protein, putative n=3 Tax=Brugia TaxID=6278 RepID=A0A4E9F0V3_BRUMA|nr:MNN4 protein, putative [Brugia malayi]VIO89800.1 MNN4 protein, putative [Brugia malayi]